MASELRIGVDVGGTNTDGVLLDLSKTGTESRGVLAWTKALTTSNPSEGIQNAIQTLLDTSAVSPSDIGAVTIGTTHFINAVVEKDSNRLAKVAVIRLSGPFSHSTPPFIDWQHGLKKIIYGYHVCVNGGLEVDGSLIKDIRPEEIEQQCDILIEKGIKCVVVNGIFSPIDRQYFQEERVAEIIKKRIPDAFVVMSKDVANLGFLERENAAILNASILPFATRTIKNFHVAIRTLNLKCPVFLTQNDGTVLLASLAVHLPIRTFCSGPTNSMRGAAFLVASEKKSDVPQEQMMVVDVGGTTTDVGLLLENGFPRQSASVTEIGGVRLNFSCPDVKSIGLGGGSIVRLVANADGTSKATIGPDSVGHEIRKRALVFGGDTPTTTDYSVASTPELQIGDATLPNVQALTTTSSQVKAEVKAMLERVIDTMKTSDEEVTVLLVGGGAIIAPDQLVGAKKVIKPEYAGVANAIGAAISRVSGTVDTVLNTAKKTMKESMKEVEELAIEKAIENGAKRETISIAEADSFPLQYIANKSRFIVKAVGDFDFSAIRPASTIDETSASSEIDELAEDVQTKAAIKDLAEASEEKLKFDFQSYRPEIVGKEWIISEIDLEWISCGCYILGTGGGGTPYPHFLRIREMLRNGAVMRIMRPEDLEDTDLVGCGGGAGSPTVGIEKLPGNEMMMAQTMLYDFLKTKPRAILPLEIGGGNGMQGLLLGASTQLNVPCLDGDWMGRAYPTGWQISPVVYETTSQFDPRTVADGNGNSMILSSTTSERKAEEILRAALSEMGSHVAVANGPYDGKRTKQYIIGNTLSLSWRIGRAVFQARQENAIAQVGERIIKEVGGEGSAKVIFKGKIVLVERRLFNGHVYGEVIIEGMDVTGRGQVIEKGMSGKLKIPFKNENLFAIHTDEEGKEKHIATVPDLISVLDAGDGGAIGTPEYRYGLLVIVIAIQATPHFTATARGLEIGGPKAFGFDDVEYKPIGKFSMPRSVLDEYGDFEG